MKKLLLVISFFFVLQSNAQNVNLYLPANGATVNGISATLQWYDVSGETGYVLQVDTVNTFDSPNLRSDTTAAFNTSSPIIYGIGNLSFGTTYYWRVAALFGNTQSNWTASRSFITIDRPNLYLPENSSTINGINGNLQWYDTAGETGYVLQVDTVNTFDSPNLRSDTTVAFNTTSPIIYGIGNLSFGTTYYWRVAFLNGTAQSSWSSVRTFSTVVRPNLISPSNGETVNINPILQFSDILGETGYVFQIDTVNTFDSPNLQSSTTGAFNGSSGVLNVSFGTLPFGTTYYWRVAFLNGTAQSNWSTVRNFTTVAQPSLYEPVNGLTINGIFATLQWYDYSGETGYAYQVDTVNTFDSANLRNGTIGAQTSVGFPSIGVTDLDFGTTYYWRVAILSSLGQSNWSAVRNFKTVTKPSLYFPSNGAVNVGNNVNLTWYNIAGESGFVYQLDTNSSFNSANLQSGTMPAYTSTIGYPAIGFSNLQSNTTYFWRIAFLNTTSQSQWSDTWIFATGGTLGLEDKTVEKFSLYPNPATNVVYLNGISENVDYKIISPDGKVILSGIAEASQAVDVSSLPKGIYFMKISKDNKITTIKVIKN